MQVAQGAQGFWGRCCTCGAYLLTVTFWVLRHLVLRGRITGWGCGGRAETPSFSVERWSLVLRGQRPSSGFSPLLGNPWTPEPCPPAGLEDL